MTGKKNGTLCLLIPLLFTPLPAGATPEEGIEEFKKKNYTAALNQFNTHLKSKPDDLNINYYAGMTYQLLGRNGDALKHYKKVFEIDPNSKAAAQVAPFLKRYGIKTSAQTVTTGTGKALPNDPFAAMEASRKLPFKDRIIIVPPKFGHTPVSSATISTVRSVVSRLPGKIYKILNDGGATINLAPNIIDKWPGSGDGSKPNVSNTTMGEEGGRTYDHDVHVYEREAVRNSNELKEVRDQSEIYNCVLHELGHAIDDCLGIYSKTKPFVDAHKQDCESMPTKAVSSYYTNDVSEAVAEVTAYLLGGNDSNANAAGTHFTRLKPLIKTKLGL